MGHARHEVDGAVQWIDQPSPSGADDISTTLFSQYRVIGAVRMNHRQDGVFGLTVDHGHRVDGTLHLDINLHAEAVANDFGPGKRGPYGYVQIGRWCHTAEAR